MEKGDDVQPPSEIVPTVRVEILQPPRKGVDSQAAEAVKDLVKKQLAEILGNRDQFIFQPFFNQKKITTEIRRMQSIPEQRKWSVFYKRHGCLVCHERKAGHYGCGMCEKCNAQTHSRLIWIVRSYKSRSQEEPEFIDQAELARQAFAEPVKALPPAKSRKRASRLR